jgi:drug/metabolite transporter (DMT)-like permease
MKARVAPDRTSTDGTLRQWLPGLVVLAAVWGSSFLFIKIGVRELHPAYVTFGRVASGALALLAVLLVTRDRLPRSGRVWLHLSIASAVGVVLPFTLFGYGEQRISSVLAGIWNAVTPLIALPVAALVFRTERFTARKVAGVLLGFVGVLVVLGVWQGVGGSHLTGQLMCLGAAVCYGVVIPYQKRFIAGDASSAVALSAGQLLIGTAQIALVAPLLGGAPPDPTEISFAAVASVLALGVLGTGFAFMIHMRNIRLAGASAASMVTYLVPLFAAVVGILVLHEGLAWYQPAGAAIVLVGVAVSQGLFARRRAALPAAAPPVAPSPVDRTEATPARAA